MSIAASFTATNEAERRNSQARRKLNLLSKLTSRAGTNRDVKVVNISTTGLLFETGTALVIGERIRIALDAAQTCNATVMWTSGAFHGCHFDVPLSTATLSAVQLRSQIKDERSSTEAPQRVRRLGRMDWSAGSSIANRRKRLGLTQSELAKQIGVSKTTIWKWENGAAMPRHAMAARLELLLGTSSQEDVAQADPDAVPEPEHLYPPVTEPTDLESVVKRSKEQIAIAARTTMDKITIQIAF